MQTTLTTPTRRSIRWVLISLEGLIGANAIYGAVGLMRDGLGMPVNWLNGTLFDSWVVPGVILLGAIAVPMFAAAAAEVLRSRWAYAASAAAASILLAWIVAQLAVLQRYFFLQPVLFVAGLLVGGLAVWSHRGEGLPSRDGTFGRDQADTGKDFGT